MVTEPTNDATVTKPATLSLRQVNKRYGKTVVVDQVSLTVEAGTFLSILGSSGSGKTTLLRMVAGHAAPDDGQILIDGEDVTAHPPQRRRIGMVFQNYALFPHLTVFDNVAFGLRARRERSRVLKDRVMGMLRRVGLEGYGHHLPRQLSGGQQQRVALARALVVTPRILLLDEPLSALDAKLRESMQVEIRQLQRELRITTLYVTHDQREALSMSDSVAVMRGGRLEGIGSPTEMYDRPPSRYIAGFLGDVNLLEGALLESTGGEATVCMDDGLRIAVKAPNVHGILQQGPVFLGMRPESLSLGSGADGDIRLHGRVERIRFEGRSQSLTVRANGANGAVVRALDAGRTVREGDAVTLHCPPDRVLLFRRDG